MASLCSFLTGHETNSSGWLLSHVWKFNDTQIENTHTFIQWVFPTNEASRAMPGSPLLDEEEIAEIQNSEQAKQNLSSILDILESGDLKKFIHIVEHEALSLHAMMMTSSPYFILMKPGTIEVIQKIWEFRNATNSSVCFTLDAGANVHLLYPKSETERIIAFVEEQLIGYCENQQYICDEIGTGPKLIEERYD